MTDEKKCGWLSKASKWLALLAFAGLIVRIGLFKPYTLQPFELLILLASIAALATVYFCHQRFFLTLDRSWLWLLGTMGLLLVLGSVNGHLVYGENHSTLIPTLKDFFLLLTVFLGFIFAATYGSDPIFRQRAYRFMFGAILFTPVVFFPQLAKSLGMISDSIYFSGWHGNTTIFGMFALVPFIFCVEQAFRQERFLKKIPYWIIAISLFSLMLWSASRSVWLAGVLTTAFLFFYFVFFVYSRLHRAKNFFLASIAITFSFATSFLILPHATRIMALDRIFPSISEETAKPEIFKQTSLSDAYNSIKSTEAAVPSSIPYQNRQVIWPEALVLLKNHPYGLGPEYSRTTDALRDGDKDGATVAHNSILQAALSGGILFLIVCTIFLFRIGLAILRSPRDQEWLWLTTSIMGIMIVSLFGDFLFSIPALWILFGLIVGKSLNGNSPPRQAPK